MLVTTQVVATGIKIALSIVTPASANVGDAIIVDAHMKNLTNDYLYIAPTGRYDSTALSFQFDYLNVAPGETVVMRAVFTMSNKSVDITVWSWWWDGSKWVIDDAGSVSISLSSPAVWAKLGNPINAGLDVSAPAVWAKLGAPISGQLTPGFALPPDYKLVMSNVYPDGKTYNGPAQRVVATFEFLPSNWPGAKWFLDEVIAQGIAQKVKDAGLKPLTMKLYESGFSYLIEIEAATPAASYVALAPVAWTAIIIGAFTLASLIVIFFTIKTITDFIYKSPGAAIASGLILLGLAAATVAGIAIWKGGGRKTSSAR